MVKGFTLIELLVTLVIVSLTCALSIPALSQMVEKNKVESDVFTITNIIQTARSKAISQKIFITICGKSSEQLCSNNWKEIIVLSNESKQHLHGVTLKANFLLAKWSAFQNKSGLTISPTGYTHHQNGTLYLCHNIPSFNRALVVSKSGRVTVKHQSAKLQQKCSK